MFGTLRNHFNRHWFDLLWAMTEKEIKARYKKAIFGFLWVILNPVLQMLVIGLVFHFITQMPIQYYFVFLFTGLLPWNFFSMTVLKNTPMYVNERHLIRKASFPREIIVLSVMLASAFHFVVSLGLLIPIVVIMGKINLVSILFMPLVLLWVMALAMGISLFTSALNVRFRDINFITQVVMPLWFYATPVIYSLELIPDNLRQWFYLNPMTGVTELFRWILLSQLITQPIRLLVSGGMTLLIVCIGVYAFRKLSPYFVDWV